MLKRRPPHPVRLTGARKQKLPTLSLAQGKAVDVLRTATSYFDSGWNVFPQQKDGSMQWISEQIVGIGRDFHSQVDDDKVKTTLYKVCWSGYDRTGDTWEPIICTSTGICEHGKSVQGIT